MQITPPPPDQFIESLRSRIVEGRTFNPDQYRPIAIPLQVVLGATQLQGQATFVIPSNQRLIIRQFLPHIVPIGSTGINGVSDATNAVSGVFNVGIPAPGDVIAGGTVEDRMWSWAQNCRVSLSMVSSTFQLFPQYQFSLGDLMSYNAAKTTLFDMPAIIPQGTTLEMLASLQDSTAAGSNTQYGIVIVGTYESV
jgi:hypothetical protein